MIKKLSLLLVTVLIFSSPVLSQNSESSSTIKPFRSDVGIVGITANFNALNNFTYTGKEALQVGNSSAFEIKLRNVRTVSQRLGVGFEILGSFLSGGSEGFSLDGWGIGPVIRGYPLKSSSLQPYAELGIMLGHEMGLGKLATTDKGGDGFRSRRAFRLGLAYRFHNNYGFSVEGGYKWEGDRLFQTDARTLQMNFGFELYLFN